MKVYDFDHTIYRGDSTVDFYFYCLRRHPLLLRFLPVQVWGVILYKLRLCPKERMKEAFFSFLKGLDDPDREINDFSDRYLCRMQSWYMKGGSSADVVISASPVFLIEQFSKKTTRFVVIASEVDMMTGRFWSRNCYGDEKIRRFRERFPDESVEEFYSDSDSDLPFARLAKRAYKVKKDVIVDWEDN